MKNRPNRFILAGAFWFTSLLLLPISVWAATGWSGTAGSNEGCVGWNCDGKNPCTGMGCDSAAPTKDAKAGSTKSTGAGPTKSGSTKDAKDSSNATKGSTRNSKKPPAVPDVESLGKSKKPDGWGGDRNSDTRTKDQANQSAAKDTVNDLQDVLRGGKPPPQGWDGGLKSDSRTIEQKLDTP